jgi:hypothetical protein
VGFLSFLLPRAVTIGELRNRRKPRFETQLATFLFVREAAVEMKQVVVVRGTVDMGIDNAPRFSGGRTFEHRRLLHVGERLSLTTGEATRLAELGVVKLVSSS